MKSIIIRITLICLFLVLSIPNHTSAEIMTFIKEYTYQASEYDSKVTCRVLALEQVKRLLLEEVGTYLESNTEVLNYKITKDQITTLSAGVVQTEIVDENWDGNSLKFWIKAKISTDPASVIKSINKIRDNSKLSKELAEIRKRENVLLKEVEQLKKDLTKEKSSSNTAKQENYNNTVSKISSLDWLEKGFVYVDTGNFEDAKMAVNKAIDLDKKNYKAYSLRSLIYAHFNELTQAMEDCAMAISLNPQNATNYSARGIIYLKMGNPELALKDCQKAIRLEPKEGSGYVCRSSVHRDAGNHKKELDDINTALKYSPHSALYSSRAAIYRKLGNVEKAFRDYDKAIQLAPFNSTVYFDRANFYISQIKYNQAIKDIDQAISLSDHVSLYYETRGLIYSIIGNNVQALRDYNKAIDISPGRGDAYFGRGLCYLDLGDYNQALNNIRTAARLEFKQAQEYLLGKGLTW